jgi:hypothetical protein
MTTCLGLFRDIESSTRSPSNIGPRGGWLRTCRTVGRPRAAVATELARASLGAPCGCCMGGTPRRRFPWSLQASRPATEERRQHRRSRARDAAHLLAVTAHQSDAEPCSGLVDDSPVAALGLPPRQHATRPPGGPVSGRRCPSREAPTSMRGARPSPPMLNSRARLTDVPIGYTSPCGRLLTKVVPLRPSNLGCSARRAQRCRAASEGLAEEGIVVREVRCPGVGQVVFVIDRLHRTHGLTGAAVNALVRLDVQGTRTLVDAVDRTLVHTRSIHHVHTRLCYHVSHKLNFTHRLR